MIVTAVSSQPAPAAPQPDLSVAALRHRVARLVPLLDGDSPRFRSAVLLLLARAAGLNIDRLARLSGYPRNFVAACARRLHDNGVWESGETRHAWVEPGDQAFWNDVDVALGALQRRLDERGEPVWAPAGEWLKSYDFIPRVPAEGQAVVFLPSATGEPAPEAPPVAAPGHRFPALAAELDAADAPSLLPLAARREDESPRPALRIPLTVSAPPELFPGASWLG